MANFSAPGAASAVRTFLLSIAAVTAAAESEPGYLSELDLFEEIPMVTGVSHFLQPIEATPAAVTVLDREMIAALNPQSFAQILQLVPGFAQMVTAQGTLAPGYQLGGEPFARRMHVEIDGRPLNDSMLVTAMWQDFGLDFNDIERIEVIRGSNMPADGGNALLGTVNIITRSPLLAERLRLSVELDEDHFRRYSLNTAFTLGGVETQLWARQREQQTFTERRPLVSGTSSSHTIIGSEDLSYDSESLVTEEPGTALTSARQRDRSVGARMLWSPTAIDRIETALGYSDHQTPFGDQRARYSWQQLEWQRLLPDLGEWHGFLFHNYNRVSATGLLAIGEISGPLPSAAANPWYADRIPPAFNFSELIDFATVDESGWSERWDAELRRYWRYGSDVELSVGGAATHDRAASRYLTDQTHTLQRRSSRLYTTAAWQVDSDWQLSGGLMAEQAEGLSSITAARIGANYRLDDQHSWRLAAAIGGRQPTLLESHRASVARNKPSSTVDLLTLVNSQLDVERSELVELGYHWRSGDQRIELDGRWYGQKVTDLIKPSDIVVELTRFIDGELTTVSDRVLYYDNRADLYQQGLELQLTARHRQHWLLHLTAAYLDSRASSAPLQLDTALPYPIESFTVDRPFEVGLVGERWSASMLASYQLNTQWQLASQLNWQSATSGWMHLDSAPTTHWDLSAQRHWQRSASGAAVELSVALRNITDERVDGLLDYPRRRLVVQLQLELL
ncbi:TonB-dependent receptor [Gammaproteobacteria bacterium LSUCC0057]|uniref:TonB-dependent receptor n=1 Tax=Gammaproteobacteria bacterium LSUCC0057 TaxID=2559237 RepID=A0A4Y8UHP3_9GAMM|nr:TonB-dependent receptor [Gammaproteobacteria bacterium LSUCC0057]